MVPLLAFDLPWCVLMWLSSLSTTAVQPHLTSILVTHISWQPLWRHCFVFQGRVPLAQGSVLEGRGRKLTGTSAMRLRNTVLQQTGFLEQRATK